MKAKYIVFSMPLHGESIFIFPDYIKHKDFAKEMEPHGIVSAGFVTLRDGELFCFAESIGLAVEARKAEDGILANMMFGRM